MSQTREILKQVKKLEITTKLLADGLVTGNSNSIFKGQGIEFSEIRDYIFGDDIRAIDWKVTGRDSIIHTSKSLLKKETYRFIL